MVETVRLTKSFVDSAPIPDMKDGKHTQVFYRDASLPGFGLRISSGGSKTYIVETRIQRKSKRISIGRYPHITAEQARKSAQGILGEIALGNDPVAQKVARRSQGITLQQAFHDYLLTRKNLKENTLIDYKRGIEGELKDWLNKPLIEISRDMVELRHRKLGERSHARANNTMRVLRAVFNYALEQYEDAEGSPVLSQNPVNRLSKTRAWYRVKRRQTLLKPHEIKPWFDATMMLNQETTRDYLQFLLFTGLRRSEAARLKWDDVDFEERSFLIKDTKNTDPHRLPFSSFLQDMLERRHQQAEKIWVFPSPMNDGPIKEPRTALDRVASISKISVTCHDLRRTFITIAESLDIPAYALKRLLNHRTGFDITASYIIPSTDRLREPMERISKQILELAGHDS